MKNRSSNDEHKHYSDLSPLLPLVHTAEPTNNTALHYAQHSATTTEPLVHPQKLQNGEILPHTLYSPHVASSAVCEAGDGRYVCVDGVCGDRRDDVWYRDFE
jgi:hypothetical protein